MKPLADGSVAISFINLSESKRSDTVSVTVEEILEKLGHKMVCPERFAGVSAYLIQDLWTNETWKSTEKTFVSPALSGCDSVTWKVSPEE